MRARISIKVLQTNTKVRIVRIQFRFPCQFPQNAMPGCQGAIWRIKFHYLSTYHLTIIPQYEKVLGTPQTPHTRGKAMKDKCTYREILKDDLWQYPVQEMLNIIFSGMLEKA